MITGAILAVVGIVLLSAFIPLYHAPSDNNTLDVFIIDGQSNAAYSNVAGSVNLDVVNADLPTPSYNIYYYGNQTRPTMYNESDTNYGIHPIYSDGAYVVGGLVAPFAYYLSEKQQRDVMIINVGISAQSISNLVPGSIGGNWKMNIITNALDSVDNYPNINLIGWAWLQGESDINMPIATYTAYFNDLEDYYKSIDCPNGYIVKTREQYGGNATIAQNNIIATNPNIHLGTDITDTFTGTDYMLDDLHYNQAARIIIAENVVLNIPAVHYGDNNTVNTVIGLIPVLLIAGFIVGIVGMIVIRRDA